GEEQRVAIARSLVMEPRLILADEPTGNLDTDSGREVMGWFAQAHGEGTTVIVVTHDPIVDPYVERRIHLRDGLITEAATGDDREEGGAHESA
ncbi:ABC transporter ATP-binding protein, partial [Candidatus Bipolaricaulota bacterium]|nr:ABC transporter ATP-binding protein [Candidatus Bipolaricaulota bacterium]